MAAFRFSKSLFKSVYLQVLVGIFMGALLGHIAPDIAVACKPLSSLFIKFVKLLIGPIIFLSLVSGISAMKNTKQVGQVGGSALVYFLGTTTLALLFGLFVANTLQMGRGMNINPEHIEIMSTHPAFTHLQPASGLMAFLLKIIPSTFVSAFVDGEILQVLFVAILFSVGMLMMGEKSNAILKGVQGLAQVFFHIIHMVMRLAPMAAFAAMAYCVGKYGALSMLNLFKLLVAFYVAGIFFVVVFLGGILKYYCRVSILQLLRFLKAEIFIVLATSSSEVVLPNLLEKLEQFGCKRSIVGLVLPVGYSFNLDGTAIYLTMAALFIAQACNIDLTIWQQLSLLVVMIISSKGAAGVSGSGFIVLAASLAAIGTIPVAGVMLVLGIDWFMSNARGLINVIGNAVAVVILSRWNGNFNKKTADDVIEQMNAGTLSEGTVSEVYREQEQG